MKLGITPGQNRSQSVASMKEKIMTTAEELYRNGDRKPVLMDSLANALGMSKRTIYKYFANKADLVESIVENKIAVKEMQLRQKRGSSKNAVQEAFISWHLMEEFVTDFSAYDLEEINKFFHQAYNRIMGFKTMFLCRFLKSNLERGITEGVYRSSLRPDLFSRYLVEILFMPRNKLVFHANTMPSVEVDNQLLTYHLYGLATAKGAGLVRLYKNESLAHYSKYSGNAL